MGYIRIMVTQWKQRLLNELPDIFNNKHQKNKQDNETLQAELYPSLR